MLSVWAMVFVGLCDQHVQIGYDGAQMHCSSVSSL